MVTFAEAVNSATRATLALTFSYMLLYLSASLRSMSLDPQQSPSGGALAQRLGALISSPSSSSSSSSSYLLKTWMLEKKSEMDTREKGKSTRAERKIIGR